MTESKPEMLYCWRCGVEFDGTDFVIDSPCEDCQLDVPGEFRKFHLVKQQEYQRKRDLVDKLHGFHMSDIDIGKATGLSKHSIADIRRELGLKAHTDLSSNWKDYDRIVSNASKRLVEGGKKSPANKPKETHAWKVR